MFRVTLLVALVGLFTLAAVGCNDSSRPANKSGTPTKSTANGKDAAPAAADGSGAK